MVLAPVTDNMKAETEKPIETGTLTVDMRFS